MDLYGELRGCILDNVRLNGRQLGSGAYGFVEEVDVNGVVCAAKKLFPILTDNMGADGNRVTQKFIEECKVMSKLRHPHIVQFMGVYFPESEDRFDSMNSPIESYTLPWLVMEYLPMDLHKLLEDRHGIPIAMKLSFLHDIAKGLTYLHNQRDPIYHRDLTARNVLLNSAMVAKIADFGVARIFNPFTRHDLTKGPGNPCYMPPEANSESAEYNNKLDIFSYGIILLFTITQLFPKTLLPPTYSSKEVPKKLLPRSEVERREEYFTIAYDILDGTKPESKLLKLCEECLQNDPSFRPNVELLLSVLIDLKTYIKDPYIEKDRLQLMMDLRDCKEVLEKKRSELKGFKREIVEKDQMIRRLQLQVCVFVCVVCRLSQSSTFHPIGY